MDACICKIKDHSRSFLVFGFSFSLNLFPEYVTVLILGKKTTWFLLNTYNSVVGLFFLKKFYNNLEIILIRWSQPALIQSGMRVFRGPLRVLQKARSFIFLAKIRARWER